MTNPLCRDVELDISIEPIAVATEQINLFLKQVVALTPNLLAALIVLLFTGVLVAIVTRIVRKILTRSKTRPSLRNALLTLTRMLIWLIGILITATIIFPNLTPTKLVAGLGIGSIAIGLAFKDIFENFLAGFLILLRKPMRIGDDIECEGLSARVEDISIRDTFLRKRSGELVIVPNSFLFKNPVKILTDDNLRRISVAIGVAYGEDAKEAYSIISSVIENLDSRDSSKGFEVVADNFGASSVDFTARWWTESTPPAERLSKSEAILAIKAALDDAGIEIPFPYRSLTFAEPLQIDMTKVPQASSAD